MAHTAITSVSLSQGQCFWNTCPVFSVTINADGKVNYVGVEHVRQDGARSLRVPQKDFEKLAALIEQLDYFNRRDRYSSTEDGCTTIMSDQAFREFVVRRGVETKKVFYYLGCKGEFHDGADRLAEAIYDTTQVNDFVGLKP